MHMLDELHMIVEDRDFADVFPAQGQPAEAPVCLTLATLLQFMERLTDRQAARSMRTRIDWKYLLCLELADAGFDHTVLSKFSSWLLEHSAERHGSRERRSADRELDQAHLPNAAPGTKTPRAAATRSGTLANMAELFAAIDASGEIRFVSEVLRGAACGCRCPECFSPLVAKQGTTRTWHFAHEGSQERPECEVGAANLLRRLAIGVLRSQQVVVPTFRQRFGDRSVELASDCSTIWQWNEAPARRSWAAWSTLHDGSPLELYVEVSQPPALADRTDVAVLSFVLTLPALEELQSRGAAEHYIRMTGSMVWRHRPDPAGLFEKAAAQYRHECAAEAAADRERRNVARTIEEEARRAADALKEVRCAEAATSLIGCMPRRATKSSLILYRLRNGTCWLFYSLDDGGGALLQWPLHQTKTFEPPSDVAVLDPDLGVYRTTSMKAMLFMNPQSIAVRTDSDPLAIARWLTDNFNNTTAGHV